VHAARIGPNAITRVAEALRASEGDAATRALFGRAGLAEYLSHPPASMVPEADVARLHRLLRDALPGATARKISIDAGRRTGDYLLAHRIPRAVQRVLRRVPAPLASRVLLAAIRRHAWTFAGSGTFDATAAPRPRLTIAGNPLCRGLKASAPDCAYYAATFEHLFRALVHPAATVTEVACEATGAAACVFEVRW
jgi:divinyl protochlorophyllide a 8-vinyl-reductase